MKAVEYTYLVEHKKTGEKWLMIGNLKDVNAGSGRYLYSFVNEDYKVAIKTPYGLRSNITTGKKYNSKDYKVVHQTSI